MKLAIRIYNGLCGIFTHAANGGRVLHALEPAASLELLTDKIRATKSNEQFLKEIAKAPSGG